VARPTVRPGAGEGGCGRRRPPALTAVARGRAVALRVGGAACVGGRGALFFLRA